LFQEDCPVLLAQMRAALEASDGEELHRVAHALKGLTAYFGSTRAFELVQRLERLGQENDLVSARHLFQELTRETEALLTELGKGLSPDSVT
jgi:HPt (histidine-containing phosphotransfer) domain-containing protein